MYPLKPCPTRRPSPPDNQDCTPPPRQPPIPLLAPHTHEVLPPPRLANGSVDVVAKLPRGHRSLPRPLGLGSRPLSSRRINGRHEGGEPCLLARSFACLLARWLPCSRLRRSLFPHRTLRRTFLPSFLRAVPSFLSFSWPVHACARLCEQMRAQEPRAGEPPLG